MSSLLEADRVVKEAGVDDQRQACDCAKRKTCDVFGKVVIGCKLTARLDS